jgi:hypothetical protein
VNARVPWSAARSSYALGWRAGLDTESS